MLASLPAERREAQAQLLRIGNASMHYYADAGSFNPSETDWVEWLEGVREPARSNFKSSGFDACKTHLAFQRYVLEKNGSGMTEFMRTHLTAEDFAFYKATSDKVSQTE